MIKSIREARKNEGGFTLVELLIVIVILGILSAVVVFAVGGISDRGQTSACKADKTSLEAAEEAHYAKSTPPAYATEAELVTAKLIKNESNMHNITLAGGNYTVVPQSGGGC